MTGLLLAALERLPARARRAAVAMGALLMLGAAIAALTLTAPRERDGVHHGRPASRPRPTTQATQTASQRLPSPVAATELSRARLVARRFLAGYLRFAYGRAGAAAVLGVTPALRRQLLQEPAQVPPAERRRRPRVVSLQLAGTSPAFVVATAVVDDGGVSASRQRFILQRQSARWAVSGAVAG